MATFPETNPSPTFLTVGPQFNTLVSNFDGGGEQRRQKLLYPKYDVVVQYDNIGLSDVKTLWEFYIARAGAYEAFYIYDLSLILNHSFNHVGEYCGTADGSSTIFDISGRSTSSRTVYSDGVDVTASVSFLIGGGESNSDRIEFNTAPITGKIITIDFTGFLRMRVRFAEDKLPRASFINKLYTYGIKLKGLAPA